jgi:hypothetical protein
MAVFNSDLPIRNFRKSSKIPMRYSRRYLQKKFQFNRRNSDGVAPWQDGSLWKTKIIEKIFSSNTCLVIFRALSVVKISARSDLPLSISRKVQKDGGGVPLSITSWWCIKILKTGIKMWFHNSDRIFNSVAFTKKKISLLPWRYMHRKKWVQFQQRYIYR